MSDGRLVFITREQRDWLNFNDAFGPPASEIVAAWDNAPSDPAQAIRKALTARWSTRNENVLAALGVPSPAEQGDT